MTVKEAYSYAVAFLNGNKVDEAQFKALCVVCHLAGIKNSQYEQHTDDDIIISRLADMLWRLKEKEPLQYVIGKWDFYESEFYVGKGVLIPRPETEELVELAIKHVKALGECVVYDLCAGSGCIGLSVALACSNAHVYLVEKSDDALAYLNKNALMASNVTVVRGDITSSIELPMADVIISNPPYIKTEDLKSLQVEVRKEPLMALDGGNDGLFFYRIINDKWSDLLKSNGKLFLEIGDEQGADIKNILTHYYDIEIKKDMYGNDRMVVAVRKE